MSAAPARSAFAPLVLVVLGAAVSGAQVPGPLHEPVGRLAGDSLARLGVTMADRRAARQNPLVRYDGMTRFLDRTRTVVTGTLDDSTTAVPGAIETMDQHGIKATIAVSTQRGVIADLWPTLRDAVENGHEVGSHARTHQCQWPDTETFCRLAYGRDEVEGSRDDILARTGQHHVWSWVYPCGNCATYEFVHQRLSAGGYLVARTYPDEARGGHLVPALQSWAPDPYQSDYTQVVQRQGGIAPAGRTDVAILNRTFDQVHPPPPAAGQGRPAGRPTADGGIYHFVTHPSLLDLGPDQFFAQHLAYIGGRPDVWYVPFGPLYAYQIVRERTVVTPLGAADGWERFAVHNDLDPSVYDNAVTLQFALAASHDVAIRLGGRPLGPKTARLTDRWNTEYYRRDGDTALVTVRPNQIVELRVTAQRRPSSDVGRASERD
jgi:hypothetical protein